MYKNLATAVISTVVAACFSSPAFCYLSRQCKRSAA